MAGAAILVFFAVPAAAQSQTQTPTQTQTAPAEESSLPVSLSRIREGLKRDRVLILTSDLPADFKLQIIEQARIDDLMSKLDFKSGPAPAGGLYGYEQWRQVFNPVDRPLMQPYAAYNGGQLITVALENLIGRFVASKVSDAMRARSEREAKDEVNAAIAEYCAQRPDRADIVLCTQPR